MQKQVLPFFIVKKSINSVKQKAKLKKAFLEKKERGFCVPFFAYLIVEER